MLFDESDGFLVDVVDVWTLFAVVNAAEFTVTVSDSVLVGFVASDEVVAEVCDASS